MRSRIGILLAVPLLASALLAWGAGPAMAKTDTGSSARRGVLLDGAEQPPAGVSSGKPDPALKAASSAAKLRMSGAALALRPAGKSKTLAAPPGSKLAPAGEGDPYYCTAYIDTAVAQVGLDEYLEETGHVDYYAEMGCNFYLDSIEGIAGVIDRSESYAGQNYDGTVLGTGTYWYSEYDYYAYSEGSVDLHAKYYNGGRQVEAAFELYLLGPVGFVWDECNPIPGLRYLACDGLGTDYLHVVVGTGGFSTGLTRACRDMSIKGDPEQQRIEVPAGNPVPTQILNKPAFAPLEQQVVDFKRTICLKNSGSEVASFVPGAGQALWDSAVAVAKANGGSLNDDRGLYWARLEMTTTIAQYVRFPIPGDNATRTNTQKALDRPSRGMNSHTFDRGTAKKAFVSGFDPFGLDGGPFSGNPSGASVLKLDDGLVNGAEVEVVVFPVRYADFDEGLVEQVFEPHLAAGPQQATIVTTVSEGDGTNFELEFYNGRRRASYRSGVGALADNRNETGGGGTYDNPVVPTGLTGARFPEFTQTTLPVDAIKNAPAPVVVDTSCDEQAPPGTASKACLRGQGPRLGSTAVQGSGDGFLSNEIAYRVTRLRDGMGSTVPSGHVHTPPVSAPSGTGDPGFGTVAAQYEALLGTAVGAPAVPPVQVTLDNTLYRVGETPTYTVIGAPDADIEWTSTLNDAPTGETDAVYPGVRTDAGGRWTGQGGPWTDAHVGTWVKYVRVGGRLAQVAFAVVP